MVLVPFEYGGYGILILSALLLSCSATAALPSLQLVPIDVVHSFFGQKPAIQEASFSVYSPLFGEPIPRQCGKRDLTMLVRGFCEFGRSQRHAAKNRCENIFLGLAEAVCLPRRFRWYLWRSSLDFQQIVFKHVVVALGSPRPNNNPGSVPEGVFLPCKIQIPEKMQMGFGNIYAIPQTDFRRNVSDGFLNPANPHAHKNFFLYIVQAFGAFLALLFFPKKPIYLVLRFLKHRREICVLRLLLLSERLQFFYIRLKGRYLRFRLRRKMALLQVLRIRNEGHKRILELSGGDRLRTTKGTNERADLLK